MIWLIAALGWFVVIVFLIIILGKHLRKRSMAYPKFNGSVPEVMHGELTPLMNVSPGPSAGQKGEPMDNGDVVNQDGPGINPND